MKIQFITAEIHFDSSETDLQNAIQTHLKIQGETLRWAITGVEGERICVEAVILQDIDGIA
jgi:hypothetical protein